MSASKRIDWIDTVKALGIFLVVLGHHKHALYNYIYSFHMPLFFFISGFLFNSKDLTFRQFLLVKFKRLMIPHFFFSFLLFLIWVAFGIIDPNSLNGSSLIKGFIGIFYAQGGKFGFLNWGVISWFLPCLFLVNLFYFFLNQLDEIHKWLIILTLSVIAHLYLRYTDLRLPWSLDVVPQMTIFFGIGALCNKRKIMEQFSTKRFYLIPLFLFINILFYRFNKGRVDIATAIFHNELFFYLSAISGIFYFILLSQLLPKISLFTFIGENTLPIMLLHFRALTVINYVLPSNIIHNDFLISMIYSFLQILLLVPVILVLNIAIPWSVGRSKVK